MLNLLRVTLDFGDRQAHCDRSLAGTAVTTITAAATIPRTINRNTDIGTTTTVNTLTHTLTHGLLTFESLLAYQTDPTSKERAFPAASITKLKHRSH